MWKGGNKSALKGKKIYNDLCVCLGVAGQGYGATDRLVPGFFPLSPLYPVPRRVLCPQINPGAPARCSQPHPCRVSAHRHPLQGPHRAATSPSPVITGDKDVITGDKGISNSSLNAPGSSFTATFPAWCQRGDLGYLSRIPPAGHHRLLPQKGASSIPAAWAGI